MIVDIDYSCSKIHCKFNDGEVCTYNDEEFIGTYLVARDIDDCHIFEPKEEYCECGNQLHKYTDMLPYGDTHIPYEYYSCPRCD